ncbi:hypothetical protein JTE90_015415 [Oedothorax gibbosus]|uniref:Gustatory receptor n=1 Tax=Oedothorax gibbosus TaxID=931172 RepID=A0AAV6U8K6_9ARAC|nr:hypothetical protein JTE90_015415 [Oedothorax gibbosus]
MFSKSEIFHRKDYSSYSKLETLSTTSKRSSVHSNIRTILRLASIFGIDVLPAKRTDKNRKSKMVALALYRWFFVCFMLYSLAARLYKAVQPNVPLILSFSESVATASSVIIRLTFLFNRATILKMARTLSGFPVKSVKNSMITSQKIIFYSSLASAAFIMCLSLTKAVAELINPLTFEVYRKAYTFSANYSNHTLASRVAKVAVCASHLVYIVQLYGVPSLALLLCNTVCRTVVVILKDADSSAKDMVKVCSLKDTMRSLRRVRCLVSETEKALSPMLFFLYSYQLCSLFYIVSLIIRQDRESQDVKKVYIIAALAILIFFYVVLSVSIASVGETMKCFRSTVADAAATSDILTPTQATALLVSVGEMARDAAITGWGMFVINRNFVLASLDSNASSALYSRIGQSIADHSWVNWINGYNDECHFSRWSENRGISMSFQ